MNGVSSFEEVEAPCVEAPGLMPSAQLYVLRAHREPVLLPWLDRIAHRLDSWARPKGRQGRALRRRAMQVLRLASQHGARDDDGLRAWLAELAAAERLARDADAARLATAMAGAVAAVVRVMGLTPHPEQVMGALAILEGQVVEMATGEGKTLTAVLAAMVAAWRGKPCHVVTANDYLARRDAELLAPVYAFGGLSVTHVAGDTPLPSRGAAYSHDVVYSTAKELLGDYLRDRLALGRVLSPCHFAVQRLQAGGTARPAGQVVMRGIHQVIVDEADSVLIDEAVTPLIISMPHPDGSLEQAVQDAVVLARALEPESHFRINRALRHVELTSAGKTHLSGLTSHFSAFWQSPARAQELVSQALYAIHFLVRDQHYVIRDDKIVLVDELTGRLAEQRTLSLGMQQVLEASQAIPISAPSEVSARLSFQRFFRLFPLAGGMTGTASEAKSELLGVYRLPTISIPTHRPMQRAMLPLCLFLTEEEKFRAIVHSALAIAAAGRAVLIGLRSVRSSEALHATLMGIAPEVGQGVQLLHAVNHALESSIVAQAGQVGAITIATNMAGRGTDIVLAPAVKERGGLHVIIGEPNDYSRIDRQLIGRCARQGDPGSVQYFASLGDDLFRRFLPALPSRLWRFLMGRSPAVALAIAPWVLKFVQGRAERLSFRQRQQTLAQDIQLDKIGF